MQHAIVARSSWDATNGLSQPSLHRFRFPHIHFHLHPAFRRSEDIICRRPPDLKSIDLVIRLLTFRLYRILTYNLLFTHTSHHFSGGSSMLLRGSLSRYVP